MTYRERLRSTVQNTVVPVLQDTAFEALEKLLGEAEEHYYQQGKRIGKEEGRAEMLQEVKDTLFKGIN